MTNSSTPSQQAQIPKSLAHNLQKMILSAAASEADISAAIKNHANKIHAAVDATHAVVDIDSLVQQWKLLCTLNTHIGMAVMEVQAAASALQALEHPIQMKDAPSANPVQVQTNSTAPATKVATNTSVTTPSVTSEPTPSAEPPASVTARVEKKPTKTTSVAIKKLKAAKPAIVSQAPQEDKVTEASPRPTLTLPKPSDAQAIKQDSAAEDLKGNSDKLMRYFAPRLSPVNFNMVNQTQAANESGIPLGSLTALIRKLTQAGYLDAGPSGTLKIGRAYAAAPTTDSARTAVTNPATPEAALTAALEKEAASA